jgi:hypothetical protein
VVFKEFDFIIDYALDFIEGVITELSIFNYWVNLYFFVSFEYRSFGILLLSNVD